jgi:uncharacterized protein YukE
MVRRAEEWDLVGGNPAPGHPEAFLELARDFESTAENAEDAYRRLNRMRDQVDDRVWKGEAAEGFKDRIGKLPNDLRKLFQSYDAASDAMATYGTTLQELQARAHAAVDETVRAREEMVAAEQARQVVLSSDPTAPTTVQDDAIEAARARLRGAVAQVEDIGQDRRAAETRALAGLEHAGDVGIQNKGWGARILGRIADACEFVAFTIAVVATVLVVVVLIATPGLGWATLGAALAAGSPLFAWAMTASGIALGAQLLSKAVFHDEDVTWGQWLKDFGLFAVTAGIGEALSVFKLSQARSVLVEFEQITTQVRPVLRLAEASDGFLALRPGLGARTTVRYVRTELVVKVLQPLHLGTLWDLGQAWVEEVPRYLRQHPDVARGLGVRPPPGVILAGTAGGGGLTFVHTPITLRTAA